MKKQFTILLALLILTVIPLTVDASVCNIRTGTCYTNVLNCSSAASAGDTCTITDGNTYTQPVITAGAQNLTFTTNSTTGTPTVTSTDAGGATFDFFVTNTGNVTISGLHIQNPDGMGIAVNNASRLVVTNNDFNISETTATTYGFGGAVGIYFEGNGANHLIQNNTFSHINGTDCCTTAIHIDSNPPDAPEIDSISILDNTITVNATGSQGSFEGGVAFYSYAAAAKTATFDIQRNVIDITGFAADGYAFALGMFGYNDSYYFKDNTLTVRGEDGIAGEYFEQANGGESVATSINNTIYVTSTGGQSARPIVVTKMLQVTSTNDTMTNGIGQSDIGIGAQSSGACRGVDSVYVNNPTWSGNISFGADPNSFFHFFGTKCGTADVTYITTVNTTVSGATITINSTAPDGRNPTNTASGITDANGLFIKELGAFYADNVTYSVIPYNTFSPYNFTASKTGYVDNDTLATLSNGNTEVLLLLSATPVIPSSSGYTATYSSADIAPASIDGIVTFIVVFVSLAAVVGIVLLYSWIRRKIR